MSKPQSYHWTPPLEPRFCAVLAESGSVRAASRAVGMSAKSAYARRARDAGFAARWYAAVREARDVQFDVLIEAFWDGIVSHQVRNPVTGRAGWRRADPRLGRGRGMGLLNRLDRGVGGGSAKRRFRCYLWRKTAVNERAMIADDGGHRHAVIDTLSRAFADDPALTFLKPDVAARARMLPKFFAHMRREDAKLGTVNLSPGGEVATLWRAPGRHKEQLYGEFLTTLIYLRVLGLAANRGSAVGAAMARHHPQEPHWYLRFIGVRPDQQGKGWGGVALNHGIARAEADGLPIYLETATPENVGLYQRFGFKIIDEWDIPGGGPHFWGMWREVGV